MKKEEKMVEEVEVEDYDLDAIAKAVKSFVEDSNDVVELAGNPNLKHFLPDIIRLLIRYP